MGGYLVRIVFLMMLIPTVNLSAQINYSEDVLAVGSPFLISPYDTSVRGNGLLMKKGDRFFKVDLTSSHPNISCTGDRVTFYNSSYGSYDDIYVKRCYVYSDARGKVNVKTLNATQKLLKSIRPVVCIDSSDCHYGIDANMLSEQFPSMVDEDEYGSKMINYSALVPVMIEILNDMNAKIDEREVMISELRKKILTLQLYSE